VVREGFPKRMPDGSGTQVFPDRIKDTALSIAGSNPAVRFIAQRHVVMVKPIRLMTQF